MNETRAEVLGCGAAAARRERDTAIVERDRARGEADGYAEQLADTLTVLARHGADLDAGSPAAVLDLALHAAREAAPTAIGDAFAQRTAATA